MVNREQLREICDKYGLDSKKIIKNNENVIEKADYTSICYVLDYLKDTLKITSNSNNISLVSPIFSEKVESFQKYTLVIKSKTDNKEPLYINNAYILHEDNSKTRLKVYTEVTNKEFTEYSLIFENDIP